MARDRRITSNPEGQEVSTTLPVCLRSPVTYHRCANLLPLISFDSPACRVLRCSINARRNVRIRPVLSSHRIRECSREATICTPAPESTEKNLVITNSSSGDASSLALALGRLSKWKSLKTTLSCREEERRGSRPTEMGLRPVAKGAENVAIPMPIPSQCRISKVLRRAKEIRRRPVPM
jgi:hypothetical protein